MIKIAVASRRYNKNAFGGKRKAAAVLEGRILKEE